MDTATRRTQRELSRILRIDRAARAVTELRAATVDAEVDFAGELGAVAPSMRESAVNLLHYLAVRSHDVRDLQDQLERLGLSSLGRMEAHVSASLQAVLEALHALRGDAMPAEEAEEPLVTFDSGDTLLAAHAAAALGPLPAGRETRIMVTMPGQAAEAPGLIRELVEAGMDVMRINCAHDSPAVWEQMVQHLRRAVQETGRECLVEFDLAGPKLRTGPLEPGPAVVKWRPKRDAIGCVIAPARIRFVDGSPDVEADEANIPVEGSFLAKAKVGDAIVFTDARKRKRSLDVVAVEEGACVCETGATAYVVPGTRLTLQRTGKAVAHGEVGSLPTREQWVMLHLGDTLDVLFGDQPGRDAVIDDDGRVVEPAFVSCDSPDVFRSVRAGEPILFDDGRIRGMIREVHRESLTVEITAVHGNSAKLKAGKGINLPESQLSLPALTAKDLEDLAFIARHADMVALSFVQGPSDVEALLAQLRQLEASHLGIVLKIETQAAFSRLPVLLLTALRHHSVAVMVARGDLGVEVGFERLSEVQEEILWLCEAAHVPVIWATQVLESLAKGGIPSRAEVTDAAMGSRAECVMLNKGPYIRETLRFLVDVLNRMREHQHKKSARLRKLRVADTTSARRKLAKAID
jgi:pyruvate kinase